MFLENTWRKITYCLTNLLGKGVMDKFELLKKNQECDFSLPCRWIFLPCERGVFFKFKMLYMKEPNLI